MTLLHRQLSAVCGLVASIVLLLAVMAGQLVGLLLSAVTP